MKENKQASLDSPSGEKHTLFQRNDNDAANDPVTDVGWVCHDLSKLIRGKEVGGEMGRDINQDQERRVGEL